MACLYERDQNTTQLWLMAVPEIEAKTTHLQISAWVCWTISLVLPHYVLKTHFVWKKTQSTPVHETLETEPAASVMRVLNSASCCLVPPAAHSAWINILACVEKLVHKVC